jgi:hypothetical protein
MLDSEGKNMEEHRVAATLRVGDVHFERSACGRYVFTCSTDPGIPIGSQTNEEWMRTHERARLMADEIRRDEHKVLRFPRPDPARRGKPRKRPGPHAASSAEGAVPLV